MFHRFFILLVLNVLIFGFPVLAGEKSNANLHIWNHSSHSYLVLELEPAPGWQLFWKNPGEEGLELVVDWENLPQSFDGEWVWERPTRWKKKDKYFFGYSKKVYLYMKSNSPINEKVGGYFQWMVCSEDCVSEGKYLKPSFGGENSSSAKEFFTRLEAQNNNPYPVLPPSEWKASFQEKNDTFILELNTDSYKSDSLGKLDFFPLEPDYMTSDSPRFFQTSENTWTIEIKKNPNFSGEPEILSGWIQTENLTYSIPFVKSTSYFYFQAIVFAFLGGMLLNLMPCVFPILTMKAMAVVQSSTLDKKDKLKDSLFYSLGILVFFSFLYMLTLIIRSGGDTLGWGFQLQNPVFVFFLSTLFVLMGFQMMGWIEWNVGVSGSLAKLSDKSGGLGSFFSGALAVLVATPCTAPFMGTAMAYAFSEPAWVGITVFSSLAMGMAFPIVLLQNSKLVARYIPKPGAWMVTFKEFLAFPLFLTSVWLLWVLSGITDRNSVFFLMGGIVVILLLVWVNKKNQKPFVKTLVFSLIIAVLVTLVFSIDKPFHQYPTQSEGKNLDQYGFSKSYPFSDPIFKTLLEEEEPVFLYFTADWCVTCKYNEKTVFSKNSVEEHFVRNKVRVVKADWTNEDENITKNLESFGRNGVPLYVYYSQRKNKPPKILPQLLSESVLRKELSLPIP